MTTRWPAVAGLAAAAGAEVAAASAGFAPSAGLAAGAGGGGAAPPQAATITEPARLPSTSAVPCRSWRLDTRCVTLLVIPVLPALACHDRRHDALEPQTGLRGWCPHRRRAHLSC